MRFFGKSVRTPNMSAKLPILAILGGVGASLVVRTAVGQVMVPDQAERGHRVSDDSYNEVETTVPSAGNELLRHAILALESRRSVSAKIRISDVDLFDCNPVGSGAYLEQRSDRESLFRLEVRMQLAGEPSSLLHVCDGQYLWMYRKLGEQERLARMNAGRVEQALEESGKIQEMTKVGYWPGLGGLPRLLRALEAAFDFHSVEEALLANQVPVWRLRGEWRQDRLAELGSEREGGKKGTPLDMNQLPDHVPNRVVLSLGKTDSFPYRIEFRRAKPSRRKGEGASKDRSIITLQFSEVNLNASIHPTRFLYSPGDLEYSDDTKRFLKKLGLER